MRILVLVHEYPPVGGGGGKVAEDLCERLVQRGHEILVITSRLIGQTEQETRKGVKIHRVSCNRQYAYKATFISMVLYILNGYQEARKVIHSWKPDGIHVHFAVPAGALAWLLSLRTGLPYLLTAHLGDVPGGVPEKTGKWFRFIFPLTPPIWDSAARVVAVSEFTRSLARKSYSAEIEVIPNGVDLQNFTSTEIKAHQPPEIIFAGRFVPQKNPLQVVHSLGELKDLPWHCTMAGDGPLHPEVEAEIQRLELSGRISLPGWITPEEVIARLGESDLLFMPSLSEGLPVVGVQAMASGLALVVGKTGGWMDLVHPGENGFLVDSQDKQGFSVALRRFLSDPPFLLESRKVSRRYSADFDLEKIVTRYEDLLKEMVAGRGK